MTPKTMPERAPEEPLEVPLEDALEVAPEMALEASLKMPLFEKCCLSTLLEEQSVACLLGFHAPEDWFQDEHESDS